MPRKKPQRAEDEYYDPPMIMGVGSFSLYREDIRKRKPDTVIRGFVRQKEMPKVRTRKK